MCRFSTPEDIGYQRIKQHIANFVQQAVTKGKYYIYILPRANTDLKTQESFNSSKVFMILRSKLFSLTFSRPARWTFISGNE